MENIGKVLKEARESKNLTLDEISQETHILTRYLNAIEEENYSIVPDRIYVIGIIRKYADYLGLDGGEMVRLFMDDVNTTPKTTIREREKVSRHSLNLNFKPLITVLTVVVLIGVFVVVIHMNPYKNVNVPSSPSEPKTQTQTPVSKTPEPPSQTPTNEDQPKTPDKLSMVIKFSGDCWIRAVDEDGNVLQEKKFSAGEEVTLEAKEITLRLGYPGNAEVVLNGKELPPIGSAGSPTTKKFTLEDVNSQGQTP